MSYPLIKCPKCGYVRFDVWCGSCERRQCGYVDRTLIEKKGR